MPKPAASLILATGLLLAGCAPTSPAPSPVDASPSATAEDGVAGWRITTSAVGPIALGDDRASVEAELDGFTVSEDCPNPDALLATDTGTGSAVWVLFSSDAVDSITVGGALLGASDGPIRTAEGVGTGSSAADVRSAYPDAVEVDEGYSPELRVKAADGWLSFELDSAEGSVGAVTVADGHGPIAEFCG